VVVGIVFLIPIDVILLVIVPLKALAGRVCRGMAAG
jgi:hypothetical protein